MDRRIEKTRNVLKKTLISLLGEKDIHTISITELADVAGVNRGTFYLHYKDVYDIADCIQKEETEVIKGFIDSHLDEYKSYNYIPVLTNIADHISNNLDVYKVLLGENGSYRFLSSFKNKMAESFFTSNKRLVKRYDNDYLTIVANFIIFGLIGIFQNWVITNCKMSKEKIVSIVSQVFIQGVRNVQF